MKETLVKYLAGLLDADGSLSFNFTHDQKRPGRYFIKISLNLTASDEVDTLGLIENLPGITGMGTTSRYGPEKQFVQWRVYKRSDLERLIPRLVKYMCVKAQHWQWIFNKWRDLRSENKTCSVDERKQLTLECKQSRIDRTGPLKPKNHASWAWAAGFLDGDGSYILRRFFNKRDQKYNLKILVSAVAHENDIQVLSFLKKSFGGQIYDHAQSKNVYVWRRNLGPKDRSFALRFLPKIVRHAKLKRHKIEEMLSFIHQQRLSITGPAG